MGNGNLDRNRTRPYDPLQRPEILYSVRIIGEWIKKLELQSARRERKAANRNKAFSQLAVSPKKYQI
jgi:hypothetical protein